MKKKGSSVSLFLTQTEGLGSFFFAFFFVGCCVSHNKIIVTNLYTEQRALSLLWFTSFQEYYSTHNNNKKN